MLASGEYRMVKLWQREPNLPQFTLGAEPASASASAPMANGSPPPRTDNVIRLWDTANGKPVKELPGHTGSRRRSHFRPIARKLASGSADKTRARLGHRDAASCSAQVESRAAKSSAVAWVLGGKQVASGGRRQLIRLWSCPRKADAPLDASARNSPATPSRSPRSRPSPDGKQLLSGSSDGSVRQWVARNAGKQVRQMDHGAPVVAVAISPNGKVLRLRRRQLRARLWNAEKGQQIAELKGDHRAARGSAQTRAAVALCQRARSPTGRRRSRPPPKRSRTAKPTP